VGIPEEQLAQRLRQGYDAFNRGDYEAATEWVHPDVVYVSPGSISEVRGAEALRA
jgi:ketosteroid isomerase-like protein